MPATAELSRRFDETFGDEIARPRGARRIGSLPSLMDWKEIVRSRSSNAHPGAPCPYTVAWTTPPPSVGKKTCSCCAASPASRSVVMAASRIGMSDVPGSACDNLRSSRNVGYVPASPSLEAGSVRRRLSSRHRRTARLPSRSSRRRRPGRRSARPFLRRRPNGPGRSSWRRRRASSGPR